MHEAEGAKMITGSIDRAVGTHHVPESIRLLTSFPDVDYADLFALATGIKATPEQWARTMFGDVPSAAEQFIWRGVLGLRLSRGPSPDTVGGWRISERAQDWIRLEAVSWFLNANIVVLTTDRGVSWGTFLHYDHGVGHAVWPPLSAIHRR